MVIKRGEIWWAELPEPTGSEPGYKRPLIVIQSNDFNNSNIGTVVAVVITSNIHLASAPGNVLLSTKKTKLPKKSVANVSQLITVDKSFFTGKVHSLSPKLMEQIDDGVKLVLKL